MWKRRQADLQTDRGVGGANRLSLYGTHKSFWDIVAVCRLNPRQLRLRAWAVRRRSA